MMKGNEEEAIRLFKRAESLLNLLADTITDPSDIPDHLLSAIDVLHRY